MSHTSCSACARALEHCHGTVIVHATHGTECTEPACFDHAHARHAFVIDCGDIAGGCGCTEPQVETGKTA